MGGQGGACDAGGGKRGGFKTGATNMKRLFRARDRFAVNERVHAPDVGAATGQRGIQAEATFTRSLTNERKERGGAFLA